MSHDHSHHDHAGHSHAAGGHDHAGHASERRILIAAALTGTFMLAEIAGGIFSGSLALLADAGHMFIDFAGLALAVFAIRLSRRPADALRSYGYGRFQILVAYSNGLVLFAVAGIILYEAVQRIAAPVEVLGGPMLVIAIGGLLVNIVSFFVLHGGDKEDLNLRGALLHVVGDLLGSVAAIAASLVILWTGWMPIDPILSVLVAVLILGNAGKLVRDSAHILLEGTPAGAEGQAIAKVLIAEVPGVEDVHHVHCWALTSKRRAATLHVRLRAGAEDHPTVTAVKRLLAARFSIEHATVETERETCADAALKEGGDGHDHHDHDHEHAHGHGHGQDRRHTAAKASHGHDHGHSHRSAGPGIFQGVST
ncbi:MULTISPECIES: cation diffusion facilitator family transporter [unclassified Aureimonas]|uniref:cation diffusion facilitator family transporter n=1 Tax=unclassified Aureimonas TaxID=2615206 RepID=UPI000A7D6032|nr:MULTISPECIES: cation diffusion facilitator family transporter [unclassified Aureimonas]